jgi:Family of unknown function (DUF5856)
MHSELVIFLINLQQQLRGLHWQTKAYSRHKAYGKAYENLDELIDKFTEVAMGKYGRVKFNGAKITILDIEDPMLNDFIVKTIAELNSFTEKLDAKDTDLLNVRDEMLAEINRLKYLLTLS